MKFAPIIAGILLLASCGGEHKPSASKKEPVAVTASRMQDLVIGLSEYAKSKKPDFLIVPQNGAKLLYVNGDPYSAKHPDYEDAIDAIGIEGLFYNAQFEPDSLRIAILDSLSTRKKVFVSDYVENDANIAHNKELILKQGFVPFIRAKNNFDYIKIPEPASRASGAKNIRQVSNYLYLINGAEYADKDSFIEAVAQSPYELAIIDLFFHGVPFTRDEIRIMKTTPNGQNRILLGYVNVGAAENWRSYWQKDWKIGKPDFLARPYHGYKDEVWVKYWDPAWKKVLAGSPTAYFDQLISAGMDGAYLDNIEAYLYLYSD